MWYITKHCLKGKRLYKLLLVIFLMVVQVIMDILVPLLMVSLNNGIVLAQSKTDVNQPTPPPVDDLLFGTLTYDKIQPHIIQYSLVVGAIIFAVSVVELVIGTFGAKESTKLGVDLASDIRLNLFRKIQSLSFLDLDKFKTSSLITRLTADVQAVQDSLVSFIRIGFRAMMMYIGGIIASVVVVFAVNTVGSSNTSSNWVIPVILVISSILLFITLSVILYFSSIYYKKSKYATDKVNSVMRENILGVRVVRSFNLHDQQIERFEEVNQKMKNITTKAFMIAVWIFPIVNFMINSITIITVWAGAATHSINIAAAGAVMSITGMILMGMVLIINVILQLGIAIGSARRIKEVMDTQPSIKYNENGVEITTPSIEFKNVNFKYNETGENVLENINLKIKPNQTVGIIGPTGSGKSTLVSLISRMYDVNAGQILISNTDIKEITEHSMKNDIALSTQQVTLFSGTIASNLKYGKSDATDIEMEIAAKGACAYEFIMEKEAGFNSVVEQRGRNFSGGQKQRLAIARALIRKPKILILDSSTSALDMITEKNVNEYIKKTNNNRTTIIISQRISGVKDADQIIVLDKGRIVGDDTHINLLKNCKEYYDIALSQLGKEGIESEFNNWKA